MLSFLSPSTLQLVFVQLQCFLSFSFSISYKLGDFGIARELVDNSVYMTGNIGTARFMAPEVELTSVYDHRADLYSLGLVLYYLRNYERMPFETGTNSYSTSNSNSPQRKQRILGTEPLPPPIQASPALASVILKACSYEPKNRYASARDKPYTGT